MIRRLLFRWLYSDLFDDYADLGRQMDDLERSMDELGRDIDELEIGIAEASRRLDALESRFGTKLRVVK